MLDASTEAGRQKEVDRGPYRCTTVQGTIRRDLVCNGYVIQGIVGPLRTTLEASTLVPCSRDRLIGKLQKAQGRAVTLRSAH